jgi:hypothetical protein
MQFAVPFFGLNDHQAVSRGNHEALGIHAALLNSNLRAETMRPADAGSESGPLGGWSISVARRTTSSLPHFPQRSDGRFVTFSQFLQ